MIKVLADQQQVILKGVLEEAINENDNNATKKAKRFYKSCMDIREYNFFIRYVTTLHNVSHCQYVNCGEEFCIIILLQF